MFTPAISASRTSLPPEVIISNASCTHVLSPPFFRVFPFPDAITTGFDGPWTMTAGAPDTALVAATIPAPAADAMNSRRVGTNAPFLSGPGRLALGPRRAQALRARAKGLTPRACHGGPSVFSFDPARPGRYDLGLS